MTASLEHSRPRNGVGPIPTAFVQGALGFAAFLVLWEVIGRTEAITSSWPPVSAVIGELVDPDKTERWMRVVVSTLTSAGLGAVIGITAAAVLALATALLPGTRRAAERLGVLCEAVPVIALGPLFISILPRETVPVALAAVAAYFSAFIAFCHGLFRQRREQTDLFQALGAGPVTVLMRLRVPASLPSAATGLQLALPAALLGAIVGEWFGAPSGIGPVLISSMQNYDVPTLWAAGVLAALPAGACYLLAGWLQRRSTQRFEL